MIQDGKWKTGQNWRQERAAKGKHYNITNLFFKGKNKRIKAQYDEHCFQREMGKTQEIQAQERPK